MNLTIFSQSDALSLLSEISNADMIVLIFGLLGGLLANFNKSQNDKLSVSSFLLSYYTVISLYMIIASIIDKLEINSFVPLIFLIATHLGKAISISIFRNDIIIHYLKSPQIIFYYALEIFFTSRLDVTYIYAILFLFISNSTYSFILTALFLIIQLLLQIKNNFEVISFETLYSEIFTYDKDEKKLKSDFDRQLRDNLQHRGTKYDIIERLSFILLMEDRDLISRKTFVYNPFSIIIRKFLLSINAYQDNKEYEIWEKARYYKIYGQLSILVYLKQFLFFIIESIISTIKKMSPKNLPIAWKSLWRGYGSIPQQVVRITALKNMGTYNRNKIRRKIFVEYIYTHFFYKAALKFYYQDIENTNIFVSSKREITEKSKKAVKLRILTYYYIKLLESPKNEMILFKKMRYNAKTSKSEKELNDSWTRRYTFSIYNTLNNQIFWDLIDDYNLPNNVDIN